MTTMAVAAQNRQRVTRKESPTGVVEVRMGSSSAKVYPIQNRGKQAFQVAWHAGGRRYRTTYKNKDEAVARAELAVKKLHAGEAQVLSLVNQDRQDYLAARRLLSPHQINLVHAIKEYTSALASLKGVPLLSAVQAYTKSQGAHMKPIFPADLVEKMILIRTEDGASDRYIADIRSRLGRFGKALQRPISNITTQDLDEWLRSLKINPRNRRNFRTLLVGLFNFAKEQGHLPKHLTTAADDLPTPKVKPTAISIYSPKEIIGLLRAADTEIKPFLALGAFAGLRSAEIERLSWENISLDKGHIIVNADAAKTSQRRVVPILAPLASWIEDYRQRKGKIIDNIKLAYRVRETATRARVPWKRNALRHSFASYRLASVQSAPQVALEMGNSPAIIFSNYREVVTNAQASVWWSLSKRTKLENLE